MSKWRLGAAIYFALQGASGLAWWAILLLLPPTRQLFWQRGPGGAVDDRGLLSFALPDAVFFIALSIGCALTLAKGSDWAWPMLWALLGAVGYGTLFCWNQALLTRGEIFLPSLLMTPALGATAFWIARLRPEST